MKGKERCLSIFKRKKASAGQLKVSPNVTPPAPPLTFSESSREVLRDLFMRYPPGDEEVAKEMAGQGGEKSEKGNRKRDNMFLKHSLGEAEIAKKLQMYWSKMENNKIIEQRSKLPMASYKDVLTSTVDSHQVILVSGETGCGKTTQVPQFLLDHMWSKGKTCKIVCTQPRRISAISVAERISYERGQPVGEDIGYKIRLESKGGKHSSVVFCTNGILLRMLVSRGTDAKKQTEQQNLCDITHIIVEHIPVGGLLIVSFLCHSCPFKEERYCQTVRNWEFDRHLGPYNLNQYGDWKQILCVTFSKLGFCGFELLIGYCRSRKI